MEIINMQMLNGKIMVINDNHNCLFKSKIPVLMKDVKYVYFIVYKIKLIQH